MFKSVKTGVLAAILISTAIIANAQKKVSEGTLTYAMESPQGNADQKIIFNGNVSKMVMEYGPATVEILNDAQEGTGLILVNVPVQQMQKAAKMSKADIAQQEAEQGVTKPTEVKATGEKQTIAGYNAEKHTYKDGEGNAYEVWVSTEVDLPVNMFTSLFKDSVKGTVVKFSGKTGSITLKSVAEGKVGELSVVKIPSGYDEVTYAEMKAMQGGGE